ncbi:MAG: tRNA (cytidine(34)-2'-O)-methyltransferase [Marinobacter sp.]|nr:tRNA (cytidine(34)-2'-O)-methyltransferase [Marinobacter sp.]
MFDIALHEPRIAPNTGNIMRLVANNGCRLHIIEPMGFDLEEKKLRRAGLDYRDLADIRRYQDYAAFAEIMAGRRIFACTTKGRQNYAEVTYQPDDVLLFGSETSGLPLSIIESLPPAQRIRIPMLPNNRSINLANAVSIISYEAWRQQGFAGGS